MTVKQQSYIVLNDGMTIQRSWYHNGHCVHEMSNTKSQFTSKLIIAGHSKIVIQSSHLVSQATWLSVKTEIGDQRWPKA